MIQFDHHSSHWPALTLITYPEEGHTFRVRHGDMGTVGTCGTWGLGALGHGDMAFGAHGDIGTCGLATADWRTAETFGTCGLGTAHCMGTPSPLRLDTDAWGNGVARPWSP